MPILSGLCCRVSLGFGILLRDLDLTPRQAKSALSRYLEARLLARQEPVHNLPATCFVLLDAPN